jgi:hypothetical protein
MRGFIAFLILVSCSSSHAGMVTYKSTWGVATGYAAYEAFTFFDKQYANMSISYNSDDPVSTMRLNVNVPGYIRFAADDPNGSITWDGNTVTFHDTSGIGLFLEGPIAEISVSFDGSSLPMNNLVPTSLDGLVGVMGVFSAKSQASILFHGPSGTASGQVISSSNPEPSPLLMLAMGIAGITMMMRKWRSHV